jgi:hypothetical protein
MPSPGKLELTIKINEMPADVETVENGWKQFHLDGDGQLVRVTVKPKVFKKLEQAQENYPMWVATIAKRCCEAQIAGKMGERMHGSFLVCQFSLVGFFGFMLLY